MGKLLVLWVAVVSAVFGTVYDYSQHQPTGSGSMIQATWDGQSIYYIIYDDTTDGGVCLYSNNTPYEDLLHSIRTIFDNKTRLDGKSVRDYYSTVVSDANSFGGWVYVDSTKGYGNSCVLASRSSNMNDFKFQLKADGMLSITRQRTEWSTLSITTTTAVPMDEWVYIQGYHSHNTFKVGWKKADGTEHVVENTLSPYTGSDPMLHDAYDFFEGCDTINTEEQAAYFFWTPGRPMFDNMYSTNVSNEEIFQDSGMYNVSDQNFQDNVTKLLYSGLGTPEPENFSLNYGSGGNVDIYVSYDANGNPFILAVDVRNLACQLPASPL